MRRVATVAVLLPLVVLAVRYLPSYLFLLFLDVVIVLSLVELFRLLAVHDVKGYGLSFPLALLLPWIWVYASTWLMGFLVLTIVVCMGKSVLEARQSKSGFLSASGNLLAITYHPGQESDPSGLPLTDSKARTPCDLPCRGERIPSPYGSQYCRDAPADWIR